MNAKSGNCGQSGLCTAAQAPGEELPECPGHRWEERVRLLHCGNTNESVEVAGWPLGRTDLRMLITSWHCDIDGPKTHNNHKQHSK